MRKVFTTGDFSSFRHANEVAIVVTGFSERKTIPLLGCCIAKSVTNETPIPAATRVKIVENPTEEDLQAWCQEQMAIYKVPIIEIIKELPLTTTGKVKKEELKKLLSKNLK
nr:hypothetical protein [Pueribacillus theae]